MSAKDKAEDRLYLSMAMVDDKLGTTEVVRTIYDLPYRPRNPNLRKARKEREARRKKELDQRIHEATKEAENAIQKFKQYKLHMEKDMTHDQIIELLMNMTDDKLVSMHKEIVDQYLGSKLQSRVETEKAKEELPHHHRNLNLPPLGENNE